MREGRKRVSVLAKSQLLNALNYIFSELVKEIPADTIICTLGESQFTVAEIQEQLRLGTDIGQQFIWDLLRVSRDFLRRTAIKNH